MTTSHSTGGYHIEKTPFVFCHECASVDRQKHVHDGEKKTTSSGKFGKILDMSKKCEQMPSSPLVKNILNNIQNE